MNREDITAFYAYIDRSKTDGGMIIIDLEDNYWEDNSSLTRREMNFTA